MALSLHVLLSFHILRTLKNENALFLQKLLRVVNRLVNFYSKIVRRKYLLLKKSQGFCNINRLEVKIILIIHFHSLRRYRVRD